MAESLKNKTVKGIGWSAIDNVSQYAVTFTVGIILARLLSPDDYGLIGIIGIFTSVCSTIINAGLGTALIRKPNATEDDYNTSFFCNLILSIVLYLIIFVCSPLIADFFDREELILLTRVSSFSMVIGAISMVQSTRLTKQIDFKSQTKISLSSSILSGVVGVSMAFAGCGVWSLVSQSLIRQLLSTILLCYINRWFPSLKFSINSFNELFGFGWKMMVSWILNSVWNELYQVIIGKFYKPASLGQYTRAKGFAELCSGNISAVVQRVTYPMLSNIQDDKDRMISAYRRTIKTTMFISFILSFTLAAVSEPLIYCLIGSKWGDASRYLPILCFICSWTPLHSLNLNMLQVQGRSDLFLGLEIVKKIIGLAPLFVGAFIGIFPMLYTSIIVSFICIFINTYYSGKLLNYTVWMQLCDIAPAFSIALAISVPLYFFKFLPISYWFTIIIQGIVGICLFFSICILSKSHEYREIVSIVIPAFDKIRHKNYIGQ